MEIQILGTGASDGIPSFFSENRVSDYARQNGGKDLRMRSAALIDGHLKIDFGPDTLNQIHAFNLHSSEWSAIIFTHSDADHLSVKELQYCLHPFTDDFYPPFAIYGNETVTNLISQNYPDWPFEVHTTYSFENFSHAGYEITPIRANHSQGEDCHNLLIAHGDSKILYATDTGIWGQETWDYLSQIQGIGALIIECTNGKNQSNYYGHLNLTECVKAVRQLRNQGSLRPDCKVFTTHHSHDGDLTHAELEEALAQHGMAPAYDGLLFTIE